MLSSDRRATRKIEAGALAATVAIVAAVGCGSSAPPQAAAPVGASTVAQQPAQEFDFDSLDDRPVSSKATSGRPTLLCFVQTGDVWSQAQVNFLVRMEKRDGDRVNYWLVALEPRQSRELVEDYRRVLNVTFPTALGDPTATTASFALEKLPTTVLLDRNNRIVWRASGRVARPEEIRAQMGGL